MKKSLILFAVVLTALALLAGCAAPSVVSSVTVFQSLPGNESHKTYMVEATPEQRNNLEFNNYATLLERQLQRFGFVMVKKDPELKVRLTYGTTQTVASSLEPTPFYDPFYGPYGYRRGWFYGNEWQSVVDTLYLHQMEVTIGRASDGKNIYTVRARLLSANPELSLSMGYLMESAFQRFPGKNGETEKVSLPVHR